MVNIYQVKKGLFTYDITWDLKDRDGYKITGRYNGPVPLALQL